MKHISFKELIGKKIVWSNDSNSDCVIFMTEDNEYYLIDAARTKGLEFGPQLYSCNEDETHTFLAKEDNAY